MSRDRSLEEFVGGESGEGSDDEAGPKDPAPEDDPGGLEGTETGDAPDVHPRDSDGTRVQTGEESAKDPIVSTYRWSRPGEACAVCCERVEARWRSDGELVCADCKEW